MRRLQPSARHGTAMDKAGRQGHILSPQRSGLVQSFGNCAHGGSGTCALNRLMPDVEGLRALIVTFPGCNLAQAVPF